MVGSGVVEAGRLDDVLYDAHHETGHAEAVGLLRVLYQREVVVPDHVPAF